MKNYQEFIQNLKTLISFKTVSAPAEEDAPFGKENKKALNFFLSVAKDMGFDTINYDNYAGEVCFGNGEEIGIIGHLDVVPTGIGWQTDPFVLTEKDDFLIARGLMDDKAPTLLCLYALKELKDSGIKVNKKFRLFAGCNEETGWQDFEYLKTKTVMPEYGISPDGNFPISYAEKGITVVDFELPLLKRFHNLKGGTVINAVCDYAQVEADVEGINLELLNKFGLTLNGNVIESRGKAAHGSTPRLGKNALKPLFEYFYALGEDVKNAIDYLFNDKAGVFNAITEQGGITFSPDLAKEENGKIIISCDCRIPAPLTKEDLFKLFDLSGLKYAYSEKHEPMMVEKDGWFVKTLLNAYNSITGENEPPASMGGSTFARCFKKGCAFGPDFKTYETNIHDANERVKKSDLLTAYEIYKKAIFDLALL
ncbi:MAG: Sapep family Mn(2+)-dependent dipeptidase [Clostridia bacterium]|nr:Sapep family Mn(2+)-dependent dipeptidase [Clostridia bacterium]